MTGTTQPLSIAEGQWHFLNGDWHDFESGMLGVAKDDVCRDGDAMQGHHYAFARHRCFADMRVRFEFRVGNHTDAGIVLHAVGESDFYLLHFPGCAQSSRGQHFFAALSRMDRDGFLRGIKLEMVRRVSSHPTEWKESELILRGNRLEVRIGNHGLFELSHPGLEGTGCLGLHFCSTNPEAHAPLRNVMVDGEETGDTWNESVRQSANWFKPVPPDGYAWQKPNDLVELPDGELLLTYDVANNDDSTDDANNALMLTRSSDQGRSWSNPVPLDLDDRTEAFFPPRLHLTPGGRLIALLMKDDAFWTRESKDGGVAWSSPSPVNIPAWHKDRTIRFNIPPQAFVNLADGAMLVFGYGQVRGYSRGELFTWGGEHHQAFSCRSTDDGRTWSEPVNVDNRGCNRKGEPIDGNMDLTEMSAVQTGDGGIMGLIRPVYSPWMWETWSNDGGVTWGPCVRGPFPGYATTNLLCTKAGALLIAHRQPSMMIHCSRDDGHTWDEGTQVDSGLWCMGVLREVEPDVVLHVYWDTFQSHMRAQRYRVLPDRIEPARVG